LENTNIPVMVFSYRNEGGSEYENIDFVSQWCITRTG